MLFCVHIECKAILIKTIISVRNIGTKMTTHCKLAVSFKPSLTNPVIINVIELSVTSNDMPDCAYLRLHSTYRL